MGRIKSAWLVLLGRAQVQDAEAAAAALAESDERYIRRDEVHELDARLREIEFAMTEWWDKLNTMLARLRKRDQRAPEAAEATEPAIPAPTDRAAVKAALRRSYAARKA